jgi:uncharacterized phage protein (TIGR01671 family)
MREIKFRAWDGAKMLTNPKFEFFNHGKNGPAVMMANEDESVEIMQFTGAHDKNRTEIYEGDIVKCGERMGIGRLLKRVQGEVHYVGSCACFCVRIPEEDGSVSWEFGHYSDFEVIGNIYENPELLTSK